MRIRDLLSKESIRLDGVAENKQDALEKMVALMAASGKIADVEKYRKGVLQEKKRERQESERESRFRTANPMR